MTCTNYFLNEGESTVVCNHNCLFSKMKDFLRLGPLQAVMYTVKVVASKKWCKIDTLLLDTANWKYHIAYRFVPFPITLDDLEGHSPVTGLIKYNSTNISHGFNWCSTSCGPSAIAELLVVDCFVFLEIVFLVECLCLNDVKFINCCNCRLADTEHTTISFMPDLTSISCRTWTHVTLCVSWNFINCFITLRHKYSLLVYVAYICNIFLMICYPPSAILCMRLGF